MTVMAKITIMMKKTHIFAGLLEDGNCHNMYCRCFLYRNDM